MITKAKIFVVYDNNEFDPAFKLGFGFGCFIKTGKVNILFDTGGDAPTLLANMERFKIKPKEVDIVFLSHIHGDHTGGLLGFLEKNSKVKVYVPSTFPASFKEDIKSTGAKLFEVTDSVKIADSIYTTGVLGSLIKEQSLIIDTKKGLIVCTGCSHPGIVHILEKVKEILKKKIYLVLGGWHLGFSLKTKSIVNDFKRLSVEKVAPCHCTGRRAMRAFKEEYQKNYIVNGVGKIIEITQTR